MSSSTSVSVSVFGLGYVGSVTAACLASRGVRVIGIDLNRDKVEMVARGHSPIVEPGMAELVGRAHADGLLSATTDVERAVADSDISIICVGTPSVRGGKLDLGHLEPVCRQIGGVLARKRGFHLVALRSTVLPGTAETVVIPALEDASGKRMGADFGVCSNPEFLREGTAIADFMEPSMTVIGAAYSTHSAMLRRLYDGMPGRVFETSIGAAEMLKYACNSWHAVKVAFANEIGTLSKSMSVDPESVVEMFTADAKLNTSAAYLKPGFAFGGSCLPKDVRALLHRGRELDVQMPLLESVLPSNETHLRRAVDLVLSTGKRRIGLLGLSFKADTDDLRESPQVALAKRIYGEGRSLLIWDANVLLGRLVGTNRQYIEEEIPHLGDLLVEDMGSVVDRSEVVIIAGPVDQDALRRRLRDDHIVVDLVNLNRSERLQREDGAYRGICW